MSNNLITIEEARTLGRPLGKIDDTKLTAFIQEVEDLFIRPVIGDALYLELTQDEVDTKYSALLSGGTYVSNNETKIHKGLKVAEVYYLYGKIAMSGDVESTRFGLVTKNGEYSSHLNNRDRSSTYNDAYEIANCYLAEVVAYASAQSFIQKAGKPKVSAGGITIRKIG